METLIEAGTNEAVPPALDFSLASTSMASFITSREGSTWFPSGGNAYSPVGVLVVRWSISDSSAFLDLDSCKLQFLLTNTGGEELLLAGSPLLMFSRLRIFLGSTLVEDSTYLNRQVALEQCFESAERLAMEQIEHQSSTSIPAGEARRFTVSLPSALFRCNKSIPLRYCPLIVELEIDRDTANAFVPSQPGVATVGAVTRQRSDWNLSDCRFLGDVVHLASHVRSDFDQHMLSGGTLQIPVSVWIASLHNVPPGEEFMLSTTRSLSRLRSIFTVFWRAWAGGTYTGYSANAPDKLTKARTFYHPLQGTANNALTNDRMTWQYSIGSKLIPSHPVNGLNQSFGQMLLQTLDMGHFGSLGGITELEWRRNKFILAADTEKASGSAYGGASFSGISTRTGDPILLRVKNWGANYATEATVFLLADQIINVSIGGVELLE
jgi:hypothetical protein